jgi:hypothetical protein
MVAHVLQAVDLGGRLHVDVGVVVSVADAIREHRVLRGLARLDERRCEGVERQVQAEGRPAPHKLGRFAPLGLLDEVHGSKIGTLAK